MTDQYTIVEGCVERKECDTCGIRLKVSRSGMSAEAAELVQGNCLMCKFSKNAKLIEASHKALGIDRPLEDHWQPIQE